MVGGGVVVVVVGTVAGVVCGGAVVGVVVVTVVELPPDRVWDGFEVEQADNKTAVSAATVKGAVTFFIFM